jgi:transcriptional regulator
MYIPPHFKEDNLDRLASLIRDHSFGLLITLHDGLPFASHLPFLFERRDPAPSVLLGHMARANPQWHDLAQHQSALAVFLGPHAYVSPSWYESPGVPTWNYAAVHIYGQAHLIQDPDSLEKLVAKFTTVYESKQPTPWTPNLSPDRRAKSLAAIVGFEIEAHEIQGKFKLNQNRSPADQQSVLTHLNQSPLTSELATLMQANLSLQKPPSRVLP